MSAPLALVALRRRSSLERRVVAMLRGEEPLRQHAREGTPSLELTRQGAKSQGLFFAELRRVASRHGLAVQPPGALILSDGELTLLAWLAQEQRITCQGRRHPGRSAADRGGRPLRGDARCDRPASGPADALRRAAARACPDRHRHQRSNASDPEDRRDHRVKPRVTTAWERNAKE